MEREATGLTVGQVATLSGVTIRTLHHYDGIGLLSPGGRSDSGYRLYEDADLERLQRILTYKELGFPLEEIADILDGSTPDPSVHLRRQHTLVSARMARIQRMLTAIERELEAQEMEIGLTPEERFEVWGDFDPDAHAAEAEERWGDDGTYAESRRRVAGYGKDDWAAIKSQHGEICARLATMMSAGEPARSPAAMDAAEEHRRHITRWFYDCTTTIHLGLGEMYVDDPRFKATYEAIAPGLSEYLRDAIRANAARAES